MSFSFEISIEIFDDQQENQTSIIKQSYETNKYKAIAAHLDQHFERIINLQSLLKTQHLLLEYQQKRKNEKIKEIQYTFVNTYNNYLWSRKLSEKDGKQNVIILNEKDLISMDDGLVDDLQGFKKAVFLKENLNKILKNELKAPTGFLVDVMNFFPHWHNVIRMLVEMQIASSDKIEYSFESEYTLASKMLASLRYHDKIQRFCSNIFTQPLMQLGTIHQPLIVDFVAMYQQFHLIIYTNKPALSLFLDGKMTNQQAYNHKPIRSQIQKLFGKLKSDEQLKVLIQQMSHFAKKQESITFLLQQISSQQISVESLNMHLSWLVWKKIVENRKKLQNVAVSFLNKIIENYKQIPNEIKFVVKCFHSSTCKKFGQIRFEDFKSFFNKVIFSQLFFSEFMTLHEQLYGNEDSSKSFNLTMIALASQKIIFGQQFNQKYKYGFFNKLIHDFRPLIKEFILKFAQQPLIMPSQAPNVNSTLLSFESIKFLYESSKDVMGKQYPAIDRIICKKASHNIVSAKYLPKSIYVVLMDKPTTNYHMILKPTHKLKRTLIDFLLLADKIAQNSNILSLLQQYRCRQQDNQQMKPSVQLYATYLRLMMAQVDVVQLADIVNDIQKDILNGQKDIQLMKIGLQKQHNFTCNLQKMYMKLLNDKKKQRSRRKLQTQLNTLLSSNLGFQYEVIDGKVCESEGKSNQKSMRKCLQDIAEYFGNSFEGTDALYHWFLQKVVEQLQKGVMSQNMIEDAKSIIGQKLYKMYQYQVVRLNLQTLMRERDWLLYQKMKKHEFITLSMLDLRQYEVQQQLIVKLSCKVLAELGRPSCPDRLLKIFHQVTLIFQNIILTTGKASDINADVQIPMMMLALIKSQIRNLVTISHFIESFCNDEINSSVLGQTFTLVKSVIFLIQQLDHRKLNITELQYSGYLSQSYMIIE